VANQAVQNLLQSPLPQMLEQLGNAIATAQFAMDQNAIQIARVMTDKNQGLELSEGHKLSLLELGFTPTFYQLTEATIEARVAFSASESREISVGASIGGSIGFFTASVNASYTAKYSFDASGSSAITARFVSVPPPTMFHERLRAGMPAPAADEKKPA